MKKFMKCLTIFIISLQLYGCSAKKYEVDSSFDTDVEGEYISSIHEFGYGEDTYDLDESYQLNDGIYKYSRIENNSTNSSDGTYQIENINNDLQKIIVTTSKNTVIDFYKYKNMLGDYYKVDNIPKTKTFDLIIPMPTGYSPKAGMVFSKDGRYHACSDTKNCDCDDTMLSYIMKNNIIYLHYNINDNDSYWITFYVVEGGLFGPSAEKSK